MKEMLFSLRKLKVMAICLVLFAVLIPIHSAAAEEPVHDASDNGSALSGDYWTDGSEAAKSLNDYLLAVTDETSPDYIPEEKSYRRVRSRWDADVRNISLLLRVYGFL